MKVTRTSIYTNLKNTMEINITTEIYEQWKRGEDIDEHLTYDEREFLKTGATPEEIDNVDEDPLKTSDPYHDGGKGWDW